MQHDVLGSRQRWAFLGLVVVTYGLMAGFWPSAGHEDPVVATTVPPSAGSKAVACVEIGSDPEDSGSCLRQVQDLQARQPITDQQGDEAKVAGDTVFSALPPIR